MATAPIVGTFALDVSVYVIDPTEPRVIEVAFTFPPAVVFSTLPLLASPSAVASVGWSVRLAMVLAARQREEHRRL